VSVESRFYNGPNFNPISITSNGVDVGPAQLNDADQRAEFWTKVRGDGYHTMLVPSTSTVLVLTRTAPAGSTTVAGVCAGSAHRFGLIDINAFDVQIQKIINTYATPTQLPLVLSYNVFETSGGTCCIVGYHNSYGRATGTQAYAIGSYNDAGAFEVPIEDIHAWTHEIGELFNDPFITGDVPAKTTYTLVSNATPAWGHIDEIGGCQTVLEVGDPLTGTAFPVTYNGFTYHPQELAFFDWFFRTPSEGTGGKYSFNGTFTTVQGACS
jgi:phage shock protein PspC (stress-responsive transcriptional regulator)